MLVKDIYEDCIRSQDSSLAHYLYHLLEEKKISMEDDASKIDLNKADHQKVANLIQNNFLSFHKVGVYSLKMDQKAFVFIYASSKEKAIHFYIESFHKTPWNCYEYPLDFQIIRGNDVKTFREWKKDFESLPAVAGCFIRG